MRNVVVCSMSDKIRREREDERRHQYKQVLAHVRKDDGRMQAYGWSLPAKFCPASVERDCKRHLTVPVPVYCRPLYDDKVGVKVTTLFFCFMLWFFLLLVIIITFYVAFSLTQRSHACNHVTIFTDQQCLRKFYVHPCQQLLAVHT